MYVVVEVTPGRYEVVEHSKVASGVGRGPPGQYYGLPYFSVAGDASTIQGEIERLIADRHPSDLNTLRDLINKKDNLTAHPIRRDRQTRSFNLFGEGDNVL